MESLSEEQLRMLAWAYCQGYQDAATTLTTVSKSVNEEMMFQQFLKGMIKYKATHQPEDAGNE